MGDIGNLGGIYSGNPIVDFAYGLTKAWTTKQYKRVTNKYHSDLSSVDAFDNLRGIDYYYSTGSMSDLSKMFDITIPTNIDVNIATTVPKEDMDIMVLSLKNGLGLFKTYIESNIKDSDLVGNPPVSDMGGSVSYNQMVNLENGTLTDTGMTLTAVRLQNMLEGYLGAMGVQPKAGSMNDVCAKFMDAYGDDVKLQNFAVINAGADSYIYNLISKDANDSDAVNFYGPSYVVDKFGEWFLENHEMFEGSRTTEPPTLSELYDVDNPLPISPAQLVDFSNFKSAGLSGAHLTLYENFENAYGSFGAAVYQLYQHAFNAYKTAFDANASMVSKYGELDEENFYIYYKVELTTYNTIPCLYIIMDFIPYTKYRSGDCGVKFTDYDTDYMNTGYICPSQGRTIMAGQQWPSSSNKLWDTLRITSNMLLDGTFDVGSNMPDRKAGNPGIRYYGASTQSGEDYKYWFGDNARLGGGNTNFNTDSTATPYDENSGTLSSFISTLSGVTDFLNKVDAPGMDAINKLWNYYVPSLLNTLTEEYTTTQSSQIGTKIKYKDIADDEEKQQETGMILNPTGTLGKTKTNEKEMVDTIPTTKENVDAKEKVVDKDLTETIDKTKAEELEQSNPDSSSPIVPDVTLPTINASSFITAYNVSDSNLNAVGNKLWSADWLSILQNLGAGDAISDAIISLNTVFSPIAPSDTSQPLKIAGIQIGTETAGKISARYSSVTLGLIKTDSFFNNYLDYECTFELYLPGIGYVTIDNSLILKGVSSIRFGRTIRVDFVIDWYTGEGVYVVYTTRKENGSYMKTGIIGCYSANCGSSIPVTNRSFNQLIGNLSSAVGGILAAPSTGGLSMLGAAAGVFAGGGMVGNISTKGSYTANALAAGPKSIFIRRTKPCNVYSGEIKNLKNLPDYRAVYLANLKGSGLTNIDSNTLKGSFTCTAQEMDEIKSLLEGGVIL